MHTIYHTEAIVLGGYDRGEASKVLSLFTRELGLVYAHAQGLREGKSKLRYSLQNFSHAEVNLVRGKNGWRVTTAIHISSLVSSRASLTIQLRVVARVLKLLRRLLSGEEKNENLYDEVLRAFLFIKNTPLGRDYLFNIEIILVMRILAHLGYWGEDPRFTPFLQRDITEGEVIKKVSAIKPFAVREINKALEETQL